MYEVWGGILAKLIVRTKAKPPLERLETGGLKLYNHFQLSLALFGTF